MSLLEIFRFSNNNNSEEKLFSVLFEKYYEKVYKTIFFMTNDREVTQDLTQETFIKVMTNIDQLRDPSKFESWLCRIATNIGNEGLQRRSRDRNKTVPIDDVKDFMPIDGELPEQLLEDKETEIKVGKVINQLGDISREVVILRYYWGYSEKEMAKILNIKEGTVKSRLNRAKVQIKNKLIPYYAKGKDVEVEKGD